MSTSRPGLVVRRAIGGLAAICAVATTAAAQKAPQQVIPQAQQQVPGLERDRDFDRFVTVLDLDNPGLVFIYKRSKKAIGSSIGFHIATPDGGRRFGTFQPFNSSSYPEAEVVTYRLARFLGVSSLYNPVGYYRLGPSATQRFRAMLGRHGESDPDRAANKSRVARELNANSSGGTFGIYRSRPKAERYIANVLGTEGRFNTGHPLAAKIRANGPQPTEQLISLTGVGPRQKSYPRPVQRESEIARQLSVILVIDQLTGQWDRFWKNLEATTDKAGSLQLLARDNGGAHLYDGWPHHALNQRWVSRYDRDVMQKLKDLNAFLHGRSPAFGGFQGVEAWKTAAGFLNAASFTTFKKKLAILIDTTLPAREKQFGAGAYFEQNPKELAGSSSTKPIQ